jgi:esterase/lipase
MRRHFILFVFFLVAGALAAGCGTLPPRLQESGMNSRFNFSKDVPFDEYIDKTREMIVRARSDINEINRDAILNANVPFELKPDESKHPRNKNGRYEKGILFIHGLSDSPYHIRAAARHFQDRGFLVRSILLPGHGTVPGDLLNVTYREWVLATEYGVHQMKLRAENVYMAGFSTGGGLSAKKALHDPEIRGLVLFSPAFGINSPWAFLADFLKVFMNWLGGEQDDRDIAKYETFTVNGAAQVYRLSHEIDAAFLSGKRLSMPVFMVLSADDATIDTKKAITVFRNFMTSPDSVLILYGARDEKDGQGTDSRIAYRSSYFPADHIAGFSHVSIPIAPDDPHYGKRGGYKSCLHYQADREKRMACLHDPEIWMGEITGENLKKYTLRRLTFNPRYEDMMRDLDRFLEGFH